LKNQVAVVTGASSGIGRAIALTLARQGAETCLVARRREALQEAVDEIDATGGCGHAYCADLAGDDMHALAQIIEREIGRVDVLVLCGGVIFHGPLECAPLAEFDLQYRTNLRGHYALVQAMLPLLRKQRGQIVFVNSSAGRQSAVGSGQFSAIQHALRAMADTLRAEVNVDGIRVLSVFPGRTATPRTATLFEGEGRPYRPELLMQPEDVAAMVACAVGLPRTVEVTDISMRSLEKCY
jgi:NADP-dependent 3-hydroxy acid dehydrogenase YdfG